MKYSSELHQIKQKKKLQCYILDGQWIWGTAQPPFGGFGNQKLIDDTKFSWSGANLDLYDI